MTTILKAENVSKHFGGLIAVSDVSFELPKGQILGLIGPNGAGKTTLFNVLSGVYESTKGQHYFNGENVSGYKTYQMSHLGMARTHQVVKPLNELSVRENAMVGACFGHERHGLGQATEIANEVLKFVGLADRADQLAGSLNVAQKKRLELARALSARPYLLLLDEVLAGLNPSEIDAMIDIIREIRDQGITIIMIEHVMHAIMNVSERILVLNFGKLIAEGTPEEIANDEQVIEAYLGDPKLAENLLQQDEDE